MRSILCRAKTPKKYGFNAVRAKTGKQRCVQCFAQRKQLKDMDLMLLELKTEKKIRSIFSKRKQQKKMDKFHTVRAKNWKK